MNENRVVVITGATGSLGRLASQRFGAAGARLVLIGRDQARLDQLVNELHLPTDKVLGCTVELGEADGADRARQVIIDKFGGVDILLHLVGGWIGGKPLEVVSGSELKEMLDQHAWTTFHLLQAFLPEMRKRKWGRVIVISSPVAGNPPANDLPYAVGKSAEETIMLTAAEELRYSGVTANILRVRTIDVRHERVGKPSAENAHWTTPEEILAAIEYLCSEEGGVVNGARVPLYGSP